MDISTSLEWAELLKAIAHPTRLQIVAELLKGTKCVTDIQDILPASQSNISQHLTVLRNAGIVSFAQDGSQRCYFVSRPNLVSAILSQLAEEEPVNAQTLGDLGLTASLLPLIQYFTDFDHRYAPSCHVVSCVGMIHTG